MEETGAHGVGVAGDSETDEVMDDLCRQDTAPAFRGVPINKHRRRSISTKIK